MWEQFVPWLSQSGVIGALSYLAYRLHRDAVQAHRERANDARGRAEAAEKRADLREEQIAILLGRNHNPKEPQ